MKKIVFCLLLLFGFLTINCQTVDSIKVEQAGELIKIHYRILNSTQYQTFRVTVFCSINGGLESRLKSLSGDFGENVIGGRDEYMVLWDVLKDVEEVSSVDFSIRAELIKGHSSSGNSDSESLSKKRVHVYLVAGGPGPKFGAKIAYMESWGIAAMYVKGENLKDWLPNVSNFAASLDLTKRIVNAKNFKIHLLAGVIASNFATKTADTSVDLGYKTLAGIEGGLIFCIHNLSISAGFANFKDNRGHNIEIAGDEFIGNVGFGWRF